MPPANTGTTGMNGTVRIIVNTIAAIQNAHAKVKLITIAPRNPPSSASKRRSHTGHSGFGVNHVCQMARAPQRGQRLRRPRTSTRPEPASTSNGSSSSRSVRGFSEPYGSLVRSLLSAVVDREELDDRFLDAPRTRRPLRRNQDVARSHGQDPSVGRDLGL